jgi:hypothetical protein
MSRDTATWAIWNVRDCLDPLRIMSLADPVRWAPRLLLHDICLPRRNVGRFSRGRLHQSPGMPLKPRILCRGTKSLNPSPSSRESAANLTFGPPGSPPDLHGRSDFPKNFAAVNLASRGTRSNRLGGISNGKQSGPRIGIEKGPSPALGRSGALLSSHRKSAGSCPREMTLPRVEPIVPTWCKARSTTS